MFANKCYVLKRVRVWGKFRIYILLSCVQWNPKTVNFYSINNDYMYIFLMQWNLLLVKLLRVNLILSTAAMLVNCVLACSHNPNTRKRSWQSKTQGSGVIWEYLLMHAAWQVSIHLMHDKSITQAQGFLLSCYTLEVTDPATAESPLVV